jgi:hypothetical protein
MSKFFSAALDLPNGRQDFVTFYQEKLTKPAACEREEFFKQLLKI